MFEVVPVVQTAPGYCSVPDEFLSECWRRIVDMGHQQTVFWGGGIETEESFQNLMHSKHIHPIVIKKDGEPVLMAWLSPMPAPGWMNAHFCALAPYCPGAAEAGMEFWGQAGLIGLLGCIPETNRPANRFVERLGWKKVGTIDAMCAMKYENRRVAGVLHSFVWERS